MGEKSNLKRVTYIICTYMFCRIYDDPWHTKSFILQISFFILGGKCILNHQSDQVNRKVNQTSEALLLTRPSPHPLNFSSMWCKQHCQLTQSIDTNCRKAQIFQEAEAGKFSDILGFDMEVDMVTGGEWKMAGTLPLSAAKGNNSKMFFSYLEKLIFLILEIQFL